MSVFAPDYYRDFHCIAGRCRHTCCAGWEIDIDEDRLRLYQSLPDPLGEELRSRIAYEDTPHFILDEKERCPMLNEQGLCRLILSYGEDSLCQICRDHPRFRNYWTGRTEIGLGLVCEEAARLILTSTHPLKLICIEGDGKEVLPPKERALMTLRDRLLAGVKGNGPKARLMEYLIYRHIADALYDGRLIERINLVRYLHKLICTAWTDGKITTLINIARLVSDRIEYDSDVLENYIRSCAKPLPKKQFPEPH